MIYQYFVLTYENKYFQGFYSDGIFTTEIRCAKEFFSVEEIIDFIKNNKELSVYYFEIKTFIRND